MEQWKEYRLGDIVNLVIDYRGKTPLKLGGSWSQNGYRALSAKNIKTGAIVNEDSIRFVDEELYRRWMKDEVQRGDIFVTSEAPFGQIYYWNSDEKIVLSQRLFCLRLSEEVCSKFVYYYMITNTFQAELDGRATGTTVIGLRQPELLKCKINLPSLAEQQRIASILSSLDEKIEVNRRINSNLEEQAKALFKSWFIDFEPFKGGKFVDSELGKIPEGWEVCPLEQMGKFKRGKTIVAKNTKEGTVPVVAGGMEPAYYNNVANTKGPVITVSASGANAGFMRLYFQDIWASDCSFLDNTNENLLWIYCFLDNNRRVLRHAQTGAVQPHVKPADINSILVCVPVHELIDKFQNVVRPLFLTIGLLQSETMRLQRTRDTLLPKLMSGEIKV